MQPPKPGILFLSALWFLLLSSADMNGQSYRFRNYGKDKIPDPYLYTINQDKNSFLWLGTGSGLVRFDGFKFQTVGFPDSITNRWVSVSHLDKNGTLWFGCSDGAILCLKNNSLKILPDRNIQNINALLETPDGFIWVIPQDRMLLRININNPDEVSSYKVPPEIQMTAACFTSGGKLLLGTQANLLYCWIEKDSVKTDRIIKGIEYSKVQTIQPIHTEGQYIIGVAGEGIFRLVIQNDNPVLSRFPGHPELMSMDVNSVFRDKAGTYWISTNGSGLFDIKISEKGDLIESETFYNKSSGLAGDNIRTVFQDREENIWIGFYGEGLSLLSSNAFSFYTPSALPGANSIIYINETDHKYLLGTPEGYFIFNPETAKSESFVNLKPLVRYEILSFLLDKENRLWIGTKGGGLYLKNLNGGLTLFSRTDKNSLDNINNIASDGKNLWLSTLDGVIVVSINSGKIIKRYTTDDRLPHNSINQVLIKREGGALVATECDRLYEIKIGEPVIIGKEILYGGPKNKVLSFAEGKKGEIWTATSGNGVYYISNDSVSRISVVNGLMSDFCYGIMPDSENRIWISHERGFSRFDMKTGIIKVFSNDFAKGGTCNPNAIFETSDGKVLIGTTEGLISFDRKKDKLYPVPPVNNILSVTINDSIYPLRASYTLPYKRVFTVIVEYAGIELGSSEKVTYRTKMEGVDNTWSQPKPDRLEKYNLTVGKYKFNVKSINEDGQTSDNTASVNIVIQKPFWFTWWFILIIIASVTGIVTVIIFVREKAQREMNEYLETELAERTRVVLRQKDEIEMQNIEITDSINYAKRIQSSILPDVTKLMEAFNDAFIIFHPRDIVSGDFYWFDRIDENKFIIVCADSTGHGVPGAFMSMIGSTLLQDIVTRKGITKPSEILTLLDKQIFSTLNQNIDVGVSNDGMDMVVCEFNVKSRHIRFASAMRPVIIVIDGESYYIRGNRCSVGGESVIEKYFDDQEYFLSKGDTIYLFSDGLPDQFGGSEGKKLKIARLKGLIEEVSKLPMAEQKEIISKYYFDWKGDYEQVDDILMMGIKV
jgi:ligand-binding sensor domain-containing protein/serine phosphatase RsbU (regulator of sigma subunit)